MDRCLGWFRTVQTTPNHPLPTYDYDDSFHNFLNTSSKYLIQVSQIDIPVVLNCAMSVPFYDNDKNCWEIEMHGITSQDHHKQVNY